MFLFSCLLQSTSSMSPKASPDKATLPDFQCFFLLFSCADCPHVPHFPLFWPCFCCCCWVCSMPRIDPHVPHTSWIEHAARAWWVLISMFGFGLGGGAHLPLQRPENAAILTTRKRCAPQKNAAMFLRFFVSDIFLRFFWQFCLAIFCKTLQNICDFLHHLRFENRAIFVSLSAIFEGC